MTNRAVIRDLEFEYKIVHRPIKYPRLEIKTGDLILILPEGFHDYEKIIQTHKEWIYTKISMINESRLCKLDLNCSEQELKEKVQQQVDSYSTQMGITPLNINFRKMRVRWGSCDEQGNLKFNTMLKYLPDDLISYVVFHEMAHLLEFGHTIDFWKIIYLEFRNYKDLDYKLSMYWFAIKRHTNDFNAR